VRKAPVIAASLVLLVTTASVRADSPRISPADHAKIEQLITVVEHLTSAHFIRNGRAYGASTAARFLRGKWKDREASVHNVDDFIDKVATRSSTTGLPYRIRFDDGRELTTAAFFRAELAKLK
jgi:membrane-bound lytic murein transglycosylase